MTEVAQTSTTVQVHRVFIKATAQQVWDAITEPDWNRRYGYQSPSEYDLRPGGAYRGFANAAMTAHGAPEVIIEGEIISAEPPHRLVQTWHAMFDPSMANEEPTRLTWEIDELPNGGICRVTVTHELDGAPMTAAQVGGEITEAGGGWDLILSDLKTLLETGTSFQE
jgi:uncharacterized protein YndB with AHSA1/START domain